PVAQRGRLVDRGLPTAEADQRIAAQAGLSERLEAEATRIIDTSGQPAGTRAVVERELDAALRDRGASIR
ncbi:MAG TPA: hypothetical protein VIM25_12255, partial [Candidatus Limnocylindrales bacterium]